jgi:hypothetical protein
MFDDPKNYIESRFQSDNQLGHGQNKFKNTMERLESDT